MPSWRARRPCRGPLTSSSQQPAIEDSGESLTPRNLRGLPAARERTDKRRNQHARAATSPPTREETHSFTSAPCRGRALRVVAILTVRGLADYARNDGSHEDHDPSLLS